MRKELPIPFSDDMSLSIRDLLKTKTRRAVKGGFDPQGLDFVHIVEHEDQKLGHQAYFKDEKGRHWGIKCPYRPGDLMYVRETYYQRGNWIPVPGKRTKGGRQKWGFVPSDDNIVFDAPSEYRKGCHHKDPYTVAWHKRLGRFMPKKYARTWLEVVSVNVERLQDISEADAISEGIQHYFEAPFQETRYRDYNPKLQEGYGDSSVDYPTWRDPISSFKSLWEMINGSGSWEDNPWVWVMEFKVLSTTGRPDNLDA